MAIYVVDAGHSIPLHGLDLLKREFGSIKFASNLCLKVLR